MAAITAGSAATLSWGTVSFVIVQNLSSQYKTRGAGIRRNQATSLVAALRGATEAQLAISELFDRQQVALNWREP
jgi:hypothetical protein